jgi:renalase
MISTDVLIIGAGLSGLLLARNLKRKTIILEKSRGLGGRIANRRIFDLGLDHGAPYFMKDDQLQKLLTDYGISGTHDSPSGIFLEGAMTRLPKILGENLSIEKETRAETLTFKNGQWIVGCDNGKVYEARDVVVTAPLPQALELFAKNNILVEEELSNITYHTAVMALIITETGDLPDRDLPPSLHSVLSMKERKLHPKGFVVRATPEVSEKMFDSSDEETLKFLVQEFEKTFTAKPKLEYFELKKWRYVVPKKVLPYPFKEVSPQLYLIGDSFLYPDVRGAIHSSLQLAQKL